MYHLSAKKILSKIINNKQVYKHKCQKGNTKMPQNDNKTKEISQKVFLLLTKVGVRLIIFAYRESANYRTNEKETH